MGFFCLSCKFPNQKKKEKEKKKNPKYSNMRRLKKCTQIRMPEKFCVLKKNCRKYGTPRIRYLPNPDWKVCRRIMKLGYVKHHYDRLTRYIPVTNKMK